MTRQKHEKTNGEGKTSKEQVGGNRNKTSPENGTPQKRTTGVIQAMANLTWQKIQELVCMQDAGFHYPN